MSSDERISFECNIVRRESLYANFKRDAESVLEIIRQSEITATLVLHANMEVEL